MASFNKKKNNKKGSKNSQKQKGSNKNTIKDNVKDNIKGNNTSAATTATASTAAAKKEEKQPLLLSAAEKEAIKQQVSWILDSLAAENDTPADLLALQSPPPRPGRAARGYRPPDCRSQHGAGETTATVMTMTATSTLPS
ncbi:hypothetical protein PG994_008875 [Apiospora phragmitis]|uniref:Uncharacterized protein n=1 Tax=Apiospora phragmitis TaxID=2905665 RepID=A0ABR1UHQ1_9PEZI